MTDNMKFEKVPLLDEQIKSIRFDLDNAELKRDINELDEEELTKIMEEKIPNLKAEELIVDLEKAIKTGKSEDGKKIGKAELAYTKILLDKQIKHLKLEIPMRSVRLKLRALKEARERIDSSEKQIPKYKKQIREKFAEVYVPKEESKEYIG